MADDESHLQKSSLVYTSGNQTSGETEGDMHPYCAQ